MGSGSVKRLCVLQYDIAIAEGLIRDDWRVGRTSRAATQSVCLD